jgi:hypothetical protein
MFASLEGGGKLERYVHRGRRWSGREGWMRCGREKNKTYMNSRHDRTSRSTCYMSHIFSIGDFHVQ